jgi:DNA-binding transcriptional ArsR family regulator
MDAIFKALADESRRKILDRLYADSGLTLGELCEPFAKAMTRQAVMKHLSILEEANLVVVLWKGREKLHYLNPMPIHSIQERWIRKFEKQRIEAVAALKAALEGAEPQEKNHG